MLHPAELEQIGTVHVPVILAIDICEPKSKSGSLSGSKSKENEAYGYGKIDPDPDFDPALEKNVRK